MADAKGFWQTVPGIITAVAALITAVGGILAILLQSGVIGSGGSPSPTVAVSSAADTSGGSQSGAPSPAASGAFVPFDAADAVLVRRDGTTTTVRAATVGVACDTSRVAFKNGQSVDMDLVSSVTFDAIYLENASADGTVTLLDGRTFTDPIHTWNCPITGANDLGTVEIPLEDIRRIEFER